MLKSYNGYDSGNPHNTTIRITHMYLRISRYLPDAYAYTYNIYIYIYLANIQKQRPQNNQLERSELQWKQHIGYRRQLEK